MNRGEIDATLEKGEDGFSIKPEVDGDAIDVDKAVADLQEAIVSGEKELNLGDYITKPSVTADDPDLTKEMDSLNKIAKVTGNYTINGNTFQIPRESIMDWLSYKDGNTTIDEDKVRSYVASIGEQYNTSTNSSTFKSTKQGEVTVPAGTLSWTIQTDAETEALIEALKAGEDFTRTPIAQGSTDAGSPLFGNTYIEVENAAETRSTRASVQVTSDAELRTAVRRDFTRFNDAGPRSGRAVRQPAR